MKIIQPTKKLKSLLEVLFISTKLGLTSFGGPVAHLGYFHNEYIRRRKWMDEKTMEICGLMSVLTWTS